MWLIILSCTPPQISVFGQMNTTENVQVQWGEFTYRPESVSWYEPWTSIEVSESSHLLGTSPTLLTQATLPEQAHVHLFTDAVSILVQEQELDDIIEPIACPTPSFGSHKITITYIILENEIFAMDCVVDSL